MVKIKYRQYESVTFVFIVGTYSCHIYDVKVEFTSALNDESKRFSREMDYLLCDGLIFSVLKSEKQLKKLMDSQGSNL